MLVELLRDFSSAKAVCSSAVWSFMGVEKWSLVSLWMEGSSGIFRDSGSAFNVRDERGSIGWG